MIRNLFWILTFGSWSLDIATRNVCNQNFCVDCFSSEKLKAKEGERQPLLSTTDQRASQPNRLDGIVDPRQVNTLATKKQ